MQITKIFDSNNEQIKKILIVRQHHQLGDMLCALPMLASVRKNFPDSFISLVASPDNCRILQGTINKYVDEILVYDKFTIKKFLVFQHKINFRKYDLCIVPSTASVSRTSHIIGYMSKAKYRVGANSIEGVPNKSARLLNIKTDFYWNEKKLHQSERNLDIVRQIGCDLTIKEKKEVYLEIPEKEKTYATEFINLCFPDKSKRIFALHPGAAKPQNRWNYQNFIELIKLINKNYKTYFLLTPGPGDLSIAKKIKKELQKSDIEVLIPVIPIIQLAAILKKISLYITNDTGTLHVASYVGTNVIGLFGPTFGYEWGPEKDNGTFIQSPTSDINDIGVETVFNKIKDSYAK